MKILDRGEYLAGHVAWWRRVLRFAQCAVEMGASGLRDVALALV